MSLSREITRSQTGREKSAILPDNLNNRSSINAVNCLIVHGIPEGSSSGDQPENTDNTVIEVAQRHLGLEVPKESIDRSHRIRPRLNRSGNQRVRPIMVKFANYNIRSSFYHLRSKFKELASMCMNSLTQERQRWLNTARRHPSVDRTWTHDGRIEIRKKDGGRVVIGCDGDLSKSK